VLNTLFIILVIVVIVFLALLSRTFKIVSQGYVGVVKRFGRFRAMHAPGLAVILPFVDELARVDVRETPRTGDRQEVITQDNVVVQVNATIFSQIVDAQAALFNVSDYTVAIDQLARTTLRAVFGGVTLDQALSERKRINADLQSQMENVADNWGVRINRVEIVSLDPPANILHAMALQKEADQEKRALILKSEGQQQSAVNLADGERQAAIKQAEGERQAAILRAEGARQSQILEAEGRALAIQSVYGAIKTASPDPTLVSILQLDTLAKFADSDNAKLVVPIETAGLIGAAQMLKTVLSEDRQIVGTNGSK
jgi:regulator of protease activity HflC (stomatin/prohibitin superfamily)